MAADQYCLAQEPLLGDDDGLLLARLRPAAWWLSDHEFRRIAAAAAFLTLLLSAYGLTRAFAYAGVPYDGVTRYDAFDVTTDMEKV